MTDYMYLTGLKMIHFTIQDAELYCQLSLINPNNIKTLDLDGNNLTDINGVSIFKNLEYLWLNNNKITDIGSLKDLMELVCLHIDGLNLTDEQDTVNILKNLPNLNKLYCFNTFKTVKIRNKLKGINIYD